MEIGKTYGGGGGMKSRNNPYLIPGSAAFYSKISWECFDQHVSADQ